MWQILKNEKYHMKKQMVILALTAFLSLTAWLAIVGASKSAITAKMETCSKECKDKPSVPSTTGFFIVDSYSSIL
jgi:hypothetical protein